uniref:DUF1618 domain-containing protein n=1 Tax=Aegilops tauschii TaxID=37682 RepID=M8BNP4_AEGTA
MATAVDSGRGAVSDRTSMESWTSDPIRGTARDTVGELVALYRLPDLDGTKRTSACRHLGLLTQSQGGDGSPDRYAVAEMFTVGAREEGEGGFVMRRFLSETGKWDKVTGLPSPLPAGRKMDIGNAVVAFGDRLWWIDDSWGAISVSRWPPSATVRSSGY